MTPCQSLIRCLIQQSRCFKGCIFGLPPGGTLNSIFYNTLFVYPTSRQQCWMLQSRCFKGCISRCAVKSSSVWEAMHPFTSGLPPGGTLYGVFYNTSFVYPTCWFWLQTVISESRRISFNIACTVGMFMVGRAILGFVTFFGWCSFPPHCADTLFLLYIIM